MDELCDMAGWVALPDGQMPPIARAGAAGGLFMTGHAVAMELDDDVGTAAEACARVAAGMREPIMGPVWTPATPAPAPPVPAAPGVPAFPSAAPVVVLAGVVARGPGSGADTDIPQTYKCVLAVERGTTLCDFGSLNAHSLIRAPAQGDLRCLEPVSEAE